MIIVYLLNLAICLIKQNLKSKTLPIKNDKKTVHWNKILYFEFIILSKLWSNIQVISRCNNTINLKINPNP